MKYRLGSFTAPAFECVGWHREFERNKSCYCIETSMTRTPTRRTITLSSHDSKYATRFLWFLVNLGDRYLNIRRLLSSRYNSFKQCPRFGRELGGRSFER